MSFPLQRLFRELKRRKVFRVAGVYAVVAWVITEVVATVAPLLHLPGWTPGLVLLLLLVGFPVALVLAWALEITPEGVARTDSGAPELSSGGSRTAYFAAGILLALTLIGFGAYAYLSPPQSSNNPERSIAVLPFHNLSGEEENAYFSDGMTEDILTHLSRIADLHVTSRTSVMRYKDTEQALPEIAGELGVAYVLEGSVRRDGGRVRITAQLIRAEDDGHVWAESYDRRLADVFEIQSEIARQIAGELEAELSPQVQERMDMKPTESLEAYDQYLKAREAFLGEDDVEGRKRAVDYYREAIRLDPTFALAYAGMAESFGVLDGRHDEGDEWSDSALVASSRAILLDPQVPEAYTAQAHAYWNKGHHDLAIELNRRALELQPSYAFAHWGIAMVQWSAGRRVESLRAAKRALALDPNSAYMATVLGLAYHELYADAEAERWYRRALELQPDYTFALGGLIGVYQESGEYQKAEEQLHRTGRPRPLWLADLAFRRGDFARARLGFEEGVDSQKDQRTLALRLVYIYRKQGEGEKAEELLRWGLEWEEQVLASHNPAFPERTPYELARIAAARGDSDGALRHLRESVDAGLQDYRRYLLENPEFGDLQLDPRFGALVAEMRNKLESDRARAREEGLL